MKYPYVELHIVYNEDNTVYEVDGYIHENDEQGHDNYVNTFDSLDKAETWAAEQGLEIKRNEEMRN